MKQPRRVASGRGRARAGVGVLLAMGVTLGASACGITSDQSPREIPDDAVPGILRGSPDTTAPAPETTQPAP